MGNSLYSILLLNFPKFSLSTSSYSLYYSAKKKANTAVINLTETEKENRKNDYQEMLGMKDHHKDQHDNWRKAGNFYNIVQGGEGSDDVSQFAIGLSRTIIDTGISMINEGEPEGDFSPLPGDEKLNVLYNALVKHVLNKSNWRAHQKLWTTDLHIYGASPLEAFINPVYRRPDEDPGLFFIRLARTARTGLRYRSIWYTFRNANVNDPDEVPSGAYEENVTYSHWKTKISGRKDVKNADQVPVASKYKLTHIFNEAENTYRLYCLPFGKMAEAQFEDQPQGDELGIPMMQKKLTDMNPLGMCPLAFGTFNDQLTNDYKQHSLYGMGIPQLIEGMELIMEGLFNMTVDNMRLKNTVPIGYQPYQGQSNFPDLDSIGYLDSGRIYPGTFTPTSLGIADLQSNTILWEWINNICIWLTGYNFQQLGGDTSKTAYEFAQRLKANSNRALARLKGLENGALKRAWTMLLANTLSQVRKDEWEEVTDSQAKEIAKLLSTGKGALDDYKFERGKVKSKRFVEYFDVPDYDIEENFTKSKKRVFDGTEKNTLEMVPKKGVTSKVPAVPELLFPNKEDIVQIMAFTTEVVSKTMLGDIRVQDNEAINQTLATGANLMPAVPDITPELLFGLWKQQAENAGLNIDDIEDKTNKPEILGAMDRALEQMELLSSQQIEPQMNAPNQPTAPTPVPGSEITNKPEPAPSNVLTRFGG